MFNIKLDSKGTSQKIVDHKSTAKYLGSGDLDVFATPAMIALMENAAMNAAQINLPKEFTTVGTKISVEHVKATPVGQTVYAEAIVTNTNDRELLFSLRAWDNKGVVGYGSHTRFIVQRERFMGNALGS